MKAIKDSDRFIVGSGEESKTKRVAFFVHHKLLTPQSFPIVVNPSDLEKLMVKMHKLKKHCEKHNTSLKLKTYEEVMDL